MMALWNRCGFSFHNGGVRKIVQVTALHLVSQPACLRDLHRTELSVQEPLISQLLELGLFI